ncbi:Ring hydroxylating alpha subunit catalytic domain-containing protein [Cladophialophora immunda]|nr:Ring hydroxylating alpha subunit catalytic domain-containing protein [Cladophialophora immunda]
MLTETPRNGTTNGATTGDAKSGVLEGVFPASWYTQPDFYDFERRAIFSKRWLLTTHRLRLKEMGNYLRFDMAGFNFFLIKTKSGEIKAFHNICRHRAYPLIDKDQPDEGKKSILSCGYHGWSFGLDGTLAKAPKFEETEGFNREDYSLFSIHTHVDKVGFVWINFDSSPTPTPWEELNGGIDEQARLADFPLDDYVYHRTWTTNGKYNWKLVGDNYNECYHCKASHPGITKITNLDRYSVEPHAGRFEHFPPNRDDIKAEDFEYFGNGAFTYNYPNSSVNLSTPYFFIMRVVPTGPTTVTTEYQTFRNPKSPMDVFQRAADFFEGIELEDYTLMNGVQQSLNSGVYVQGPLHTRREGGVLYFKTLIEADLKKHMALEADKGHQVWPAKRSQQLHPAVLKQEQFCSDVCACAQRQQNLTSIGVSSNETEIKAW